MRPPYHACRIFTLGSAVATVPWTALYVYLGTFSTNLVDLAQVRCTRPQEAQACVFMHASTKCQGWHLSMSEPE